MSDILSRYLPKWPQMKVTGVPVSTEQAIEIIRRTDQFFTGQHYGNNYAFNKKLRESLGMPQEPKYTPGDFSSYEKYQVDRSDWQKIWGYIDTEYVHNSWISCAFILGPHGWCHPDGIISFEDNIGKHPDGKTVFEDWSLIAKEFPFLDIGVTLMSGEESEEQIEPVMSFYVKNGEISIVSPSDLNVHKNHTWRTRSNPMVTMAARMSRTDVEQGLQNDIIKIYIDKAKSLGLIKR